jgi:tetratricopeptide (TPR) repeat protein
MVDPAVHPFYQRLTQNPDDAEALFMLWQWFGDRGEFQQLATLVEQVAARRLDPLSAADLHFRAGELWAKNVGRVERAVDNYRRAVELDPTQQPALAAARALYVSMGNLSLAAQLLEQQLAVTPAPDARLELLRELAALRSQLGDPAGQVAALEERVRLLPEDFTALHELAAAYLARAEAPGGEAEDRQRAATLLATIAHGLGGEHALPFAEAALDAWPGEESAFAVLRSAYLAAGRREELTLRQIHFVSAHPTSALAAGERRDLAAQYADAGQHDDAIEALAPLVEQGDLEAARDLAELYRRADRPAERLALLASLPPSPDADARVAELRELAELYGQQGARDEMLSTLQALLALAPADPEALALVEDDLRARHAFDALRPLLYAAARAPGVAPEMRAARLREIAQLSEQRLEDPAGAVEAWRALLALDAHDAEALSALERLLTALERWDELARALEKRAVAATDRTERRALWERLAELHRDTRQDRAAEAEALAALHALDPEDDALLARLLDARKDLGDVAGVTELLRMRAEGAAAAHALPRWSALATHLEELGEHDEAIHGWQQVATLDPAHAPAWEAVERLLECTGRHDLLLETLVAHAEGPAAGATPAPLHARAAEVARMLGDLPTATAQAEQAHALDPSDESVAALLAELYEAAGDEARLVALLRARVAQSPEGPSTVQHLRRLAHALGRHSPEEAAPVWAELRAMARRCGLPDDAEALEALAGFAEVRGDAAMLAELLLEASVVASTPAQQRDYLLRRAELLAADLARPEEALATLRDVTERLDPAHAPAWGRIAVLARQTGMAALAAEALEQQLALTEEDEDRVPLAAELTALCEHELQDGARTLAALERWYDADPTDYVVVERLAALHEQHGHWAEVVKYLEVLADVEEHPDRFALLLRAARTAAVRLDDREAATGYLTQAIAQALSGRAPDEAKLAQLAQLACEVDQERPEADLRPSLVELLAGLAEEHAEDDPRASAVLDRHAALICRDELQLAEHACTLLERAVVRWPADLSSAEALEPIALALGRGEALIALYQSVIDEAYDAHTARAYLARQAALSSSEPLTTGEYEAPPSHPEDTPPSVPAWTAQPQPFAPEPTGELLSPDEIEDLEAEDEIVDDDAEELEPADDDAEELEAESLEPEDDPDALAAPPSYPPPVPGSVPPPRLPLPPRRS